MMIGLLLEVVEVIQIVQVFLIVNGVKLITKKFVKEEIEVQDGDAQDTQMQNVVQE